MSEQLPELVVLDRVEALLAWIHTQVRDGATMVRIGAVTEILAGNEPATEPVGATYAIVPVARLSHLCAIEAAAVAYRDAPIESDVHDNAGDMYHRLLDLLPKVRA